MNTTKDRRDLERSKPYVKPFVLALLDDIESLREALCQIIINTEDECDRAIAQAAVEEPT